MARIANNVSGSALCKKNPVCAVEYFSLNLASLAHCRGLSFLSFGSVKLRQPSPSQRNGERSFQPSGATSTITTAAGNIYQLTISRFAAT